MLSKPGLRLKSVALPNEAQRTGGKVLINTSHGLSSERQDINLIHS